MIGLETTFSLINSFNSKVELSKLIEKITKAPRNILGIAIPQIKEGAVANLTVFDPEHQWTLTEGQLRSKSVNTPLLGKNIKGRAVAVINNNQVTLIS